MPKDKKEAKRLYDIEYRRKNKSKIVADKKENYEKNKPARRESHREYRNRPENVLRHNEYCRDPEYKKKKRIWDVVYRAMKFYGDFWESAILLNQIEIEVRERIPKKERASYKRNVRAIVNRNIQKRFEKAIFKIIHGDVGDKILRSNWGEGRKSILQEMLGCRKF